MTQTPRLIKTTEFLLSKYGPLMSGEDLWRTLGFQSSAAFRQAKAKERLNVHVFNLPNRRGIFALTEDVTKWLIDLKKEEDM